MFPPCRLANSCLKCGTAPLLSSGSRLRMLNPSHENFTAFYPRWVAIFMFTSLRVSKLHCTCYLLHSTLPCFFYTGFQVQGIFTQWLLIWLSSFNWQWLASAITIADSFFSWWGRIHQTCHSVCSCFLLVCLNKFLLNEVLKLHWSQ